MSGTLFRLLRTWTVLMLALAMGLAWAHLLEMPPKMQLDAQLYTHLDRTLYPYFAYVGGPVEVLAVICTILLCFFVRRRRPDMILACFAAAFAAAALGVWFRFVAPMNTLMARWIHSGIPTDWTRVRDQWEHGHAARAALWTVALALVSFVRGPATEAPGSFYGSREAARRGPRPGEPDSV